MQTMTINGVQIQLNKNEAKEAHRIASMRTAGPEYAQRSVDIWMRSAPTTAAQERRKAVARAFGLSDTVAFL